MGGWLGIGESFGVVEGEFGEGFLPVLDGTALDETGWSGIACHDLNEQ